MVQVVKIQNLGLTAAESADCRLTVQPTMQVFLRFPPGERSLPNDLRRYLIPSLATLVCKLCFSDRWQSSPHSFEVPCSSMSATSVTFVFTALSNNATTHLARGYAVCRALKARVLSIALNQQVWLHTLLYLMSMMQEVSRELAGSDITCPSFLCKSQFRASAILN